jgi:hypothetical protein
MAAAMVGRLAGMIRTGALLLFLALVACGGGGGPLDQGLSPTQHCVQTDQNGTATVGVDILVNPGPADATIESVTLHGGSALQILQSVIVPIGGTPVGVRSGFPPDPATMDPSIQWVLASDAAGASLPPGSGEWNLVVGLELDDSATSGSTSGFEVRYDADEETYTYVTPGEVEVSREACE